MEFYLTDSECDKVSKMRRPSSWYNVLLVGLMLLALNLSELSQECSVRRSVKEGVITLGVKFLNFFIAKAMQFRYAAPLQAQPWLMPLVFWFTLARSVSSLYSTPIINVNDYVCFKCPSEVQVQDSFTNNCNSPPISVSIQEYKARTFSQDVCSKFPESH